MGLDVGLVARGLAGKGARWCDVSWQSFWKHRGLPDLELLLLLLLGQRGWRKLRWRLAKKKNRFSRCFGASGSTTPSSVPAQKLRNGNVPYFCCAAWVTDFWRQRWSATMQWLVLDFLTSCCFFGAWMIHLDGFQNDDSRFNLGGIPPRNRHQEYYIYIHI